jgi:hypothetical protein
MNKHNWTCLLLTNRLIVKLKKYRSRSALMSLDTISSTVERRWDRGNFNLYKRQEKEFLELLQRLLMKMVNKSL